MFVMHNFKCHTDSCNGSLVADRLRTSTSPWCCFYIVCNYYMTKNCTSYTYVLSHKYPRRYNRCWCYELKYGVLRNGMLVGWWQGYKKRSVEVLGDRAWCSLKASHNPQFVQKLEGRDRVQFESQFQKAQNCVAFSHLSCEMGQSH
jgi:hypothetical protein